MTKTLDELILMADDYAICMRSYSDKEVTQSRSNLFAALRELIADAERKEQENHLLRLRVIDLQQRLQYTPPETFAATNITLDANSPPLPFPTHQG